MLTRTLALVLVAACGVKGDGLTDTSVSSTTTVVMPATARGSAPSPASAPLKSYSVKRRTHIFQLIVSCIAKMTV